MYAIKQVESWPKQIKRTLVTIFFIKNILSLKIDKRTWLCNFKTETTYFKKIFLEMRLKRGINIFACKQINMFIEWMSEDSIFSVNVEQYLLVQDENDTPPPKHGYNVYCACT